MLNRRRFLQFATGCVAAAAVPSWPSRIEESQPELIKLCHLHTGERIESRYFDGVQFVESELQRINYLCRDFRRNEVYPMDRRLFTQLSKILQLIGTDSEIQVISGYRSPATNEMLRSASNSVAKMSLHMKGKALDFRIDGVHIADVCDAARAINQGGVGYYPRNQFVHIDTGRVRYWRG